MPGLGELIPSPRALLIFEAVARSGTCSAAAREFNLTQGTKMTGQLEFRSRAALRIHPAKREPANRVLWIAEAEGWSRQSNQNFAARQSKHHAADSNATIVRVADRNSPPVWCTGL